jgi:hypothetical protein
MQRSDLFGSYLYILLLAYAEASSVCPNDLGIIFYVNFFWHLHVPGSSDGKCLESSPVGGLELINSIHGLDECNEH